MLNLVIFDCDGVLVDSEMIASRILAEELVGRGYPVTPEYCRAHFTGCSIATVMTTVAEAFGRPLPGDFPEILFARDAAAFDTELTAIPGVEEAVRRLSVARCVGSSSSPERIRNSLRVTGLLDLFEPHIFSAHMVERGKPAPDLFLFAARSMGVPPDAATVVEDSVLGVQAALAAGMAVLGFAGGGHAGPGYAERLKEAGAPVVFEDMAELPALLGV